MEADPSPPSSPDDPCETYCCVCSAPFENTRYGWTREGADVMSNDGSRSESEGQESEGDKSIPTAVTISKRDGSVWDQCVCITDEAPETFVSPPCEVVGHFLFVDGWAEILPTGMNLPVHPVCLSFICRHNNITPEELYEAIVENDDAVMPDGKVCDIYYYEMERVCYQPFSYDAFAQNSHTENNLGRLLTRPTYLPAPKELQLAAIMGPALGSGHKVFDIPELFGSILHHVVHVPIANIKLEMEPRPRRPRPRRFFRRNRFADEVAEAPSAITAAKALLSLAQVNRSFYHTIVGNRQDLFLEAMRNFGWMLPFTPADWIDGEWPDTVLRAKATPMGPTIDWRAYMLDCLCKRTPGIRNRWRLHKVAVQFAQHWRIGSLASKPNLKRAEATGWEVGVRWW